MDVEKKIILECYSSYINQLRKLETYKDFYIEQISSSSENLTNCNKNISDMKQKILYLRNNNNFLLELESKLELEDDDENNENED